MAHTRLTEKSSLYHHTASRTEMPYRTCRRDTAKCRFGSFWYKNGDILNSFYRLPIV